MRNQKILNLILAILVGATILLTPLPAAASAPAPINTQEWKSEASQNNVSLSAPQPPFRCPYPWPKRDLFLRQPYIEGRDVKEVQLRVRKEMGLRLEADGIYGPRTKDAVIKFQKFHGLKGDGIVGPKTKFELDHVCL